MKREGSFLFVIFIASLILSAGVVSAFSFNEWFMKFTGRVIDDYSKPSFQLTGVGGDISSARGGVQIVSDGVGGSAMSFDGITGYYSLSSQFISPAPAKSVSVVGWFKTEAFSTGNTVITGSWVSKRNSYILDTDSDGSVRFYVFLDNVWYSVESSANKVSLGTWEHWTGTYDGQAISLYKNGELVNTASASGALGTSGDLCIGHDCGLSSPYDNRYFKGNADEVRIYADALSASAVKSLYTEQKAKLSSGSGGGGGGSRAACTDSDGGKNADVKGVLTCGTTKFEDSCYSDGYVKEYYYDSAIDADAYAYEYIKCASGKTCKEGACVSSTGSTGTINVLVNNKTDNSLVKGATVVIIGLGERSYTGVMNEQGLYKFEGISIGTYTLHVGAPGFNTYIQGNVAVVAGLNNGIGVSLENAGSSTIIGGALSCDSLSVLAKENVTISLERGKSLGANKTVLNDEGVVNAGDFALLPTPAGGYLVQVSSVYDAEGVVNDKITLLGGVSDSRQYRRVLDVKISEDRKGTVEVGGKQFTFKYIGQSNSHFSGDRFVIFSAPSEYKGYDFSKCFTSTPVAAGNKAFDQFLIQHDIEVFKFIESINETLKSGAEDIAELFALSHVDHAVTARYEVKNDKFESKAEIGVYDIGGISAKQFHKAIFKMTQESKNVYYDYDHVGDELGVPGGQVVFIANRDGDGEVIVYWTSGRNIIVIELRDLKALSDSQFELFISEYLKKHKTTLIVTDEIINDVEGKKSEDRKLCEEGCTLENKCVPLGTRSKGSYCSLQGSMGSQKGDGGACDNSWECFSNECNNDVCVNTNVAVAKQAGIIRKLWCQLLNPISQEGYNKCLKSGTDAP